ncbi:n-acetyltransferase-related [Holotrichia oblita]|uniref:N-acetyltransferase-related n=1 Tax=Holotrichia oblita TaxID=644536 RepID=A0ACB9TFE8_HOLOL|nr:n-acetyltransferase-related [Holotrichia oblita]
MVYILQEDENYRYEILSQNTLQGGLDVMRKSFFLDEKVCIAVELHKHPNAIDELEELCVRAANDGVSVVAVEKKSGLVAGASFNKLQVKSQPGDEPYFEKFAANCKEPSAKALVMFMKEADESCDLFGYCNADCVLELMFLATLREYRGKGIAKALSEASIKLGKLLLEGKDFKQSLTDTKLPLEPIPKAATALFTSLITQKIGQKLGFIKAMELYYKDMNFDGKTFAERIGPQTPSVTLEYKRF